MLGIQIRITSLAQMEVQNRTRNIDSNCNLVTISCDQMPQMPSEENVAFEKLQANILSIKQNRPLWRNPGKDALRTLQGCSTHLLTFLFELY